MTASDIWRIKLLVLVAAHNATVLFSLVDYLKLNYDTWQLLGCKNSGRMHLIELVSIQCDRRNHWNRILKLRVWCQSQIFDIHMFILLFYSFFYGLRLWIISLEFRAPTAKNTLICHSFISKKVMSYLLFNFILLTCFVLISMIAVVYVCRLLLSPIRFR